MRGWVLLGCVLPGLALAVPLQMTHTGRLLDAAGVPINGEHSIDVGLYPSATDGPSSWSSGPQTVTVRNGYFAVVLGADGSLSASDLSGDDAWVGVTLDGEAMGQRTPLTSVPYAIHAQSLSGGTVDATSLAVNGAPVVGSNGLLADGLVTPAALASDSDSLGRVSGGALSVSGSGIGQQTAVGGWLVTDREMGPHGYVEFTTDIVANSSTTSSQTYTLLDLRCSGHWGSYYAEIELVTRYYQPGVRRYEFFCGNGNHTSGGALSQTFASSVITPNATLSRTNRGYSGYNNSGQTMYDVRLSVTQAAYVQSYARVKVYGTYPNHPAGTSFSTTTPSAVWQTWTP